MDIAIIILCILVMIFCVIGTIVPVIPSLPIIFAAFLGYGIFDKWASYGLVTMIIVGFIVVICQVLDQLASVVGAKKFGAEKAGMIGSAVCAIIGLILLNIPGMIIGAFAGAVIFEMYFNKQELNMALKAGGGALLGLLVGTLFKFMIGFALTLYFIYLVLIK